MQSNALVSPHRILNITLGVHSRYPAVVWPIIRTPKLPNSVNTPTLIAAREGVGASVFESEARSRNEVFDCVLIPKSRPIAVE